MPNALRVMWMSVCKEYVDVCVSNTSGCVCVLCVQGKGVCVYVIYIGGMCMSVQGRCVCLTWGGEGRGLCMYVYKEDVYVKHWDGGRGLFTR